MATKLVQGERKAKLVWAFPSRSLTSTERRAEKVSARREKSQNCLGFSDPQPVLRRMKIGNRLCACVLRR